MKVGDKLTFYTPATKVGVIQAIIPAHEHRGKYVESFLGGRYGEIEVRMGIHPRLEETSLLMLVNASCGNCRKILYHVPVSQVK